MGGRARQVSAADRGDPHGAGLHRSAAGARLRGQPVWRQGFMTDNGNHILDVHNLQITNPPGTGEPAEPAGRRRCRAALRRSGRGSCGDKGTRGTARPGQAAARAGGSGPVGTTGRVVGGLQAELDGTLPRGAAVGICRYRQPLTQPKGWLWKYWWPPVSSRTNQPWRRMSRASARRAPCRPAGARR